LHGSVSIGGRSRLKSHDRATLSAAKQALLARRLRGERPGDGVAGAFVPQSMRIPRLARGEGVPLSHNQAHQLLRWWLAPRHRPFMMTTRWYFRGHLDREALQRALDEVLRRHESLRSGFAPVAGLGALRLALAPLMMALLRFKSLQKKISAVAASAGTSGWRLFRTWVIENAHVPIRFVDRSSPEPNAEASRLPPELVLPFDPARPPLVRAVLNKTAADEYMLLVVASHFVFDAWSERVLRHELTELYGTYSRGQAPALPEPPLQYRDFAAWERQQLTGERLERAIAHWHSQLPDFSPWTSPLSVADLLCHIRGEAQGAGSVGIDVDAALHARLRELCAGHGVSMYMLLFAALATLLHHQTRKERISVWVPFANRTCPELQNLIGWYSQVHLLTLRFAPAATFSDVLRQAREVVCGAIVHQSMPLGLMVARQRFEVPAEIEPTPQLMINMVEADGPVTGGAAALGAAAAGAVGALSAGFFRIDCILRPEGASIVARYPSNWLTVESMRQMLQELQWLLDAVSHAPQAPVAALDAAATRTAGVAP
jgi:hypothetical protein